MVISVYKKENLFYRYKLHHILFWTGYGLLGYYFGQLSTPAEHRGLTSEAVIINSGYLVTLIASSYISMYLLIPGYLLKQRYGMFTMLILSDILFFSFVLAGFFYLAFIDNELARGEMFKASAIVPATFGSVASTVGILSAAKLYQSRRLAERRNRGLEKEKLEAELKYLRAQVNPHFLFNVINNIYFLITKDASQAAAMLLKFSELLRYQLYECNSNEISVNTELGYLDNYIQLEKIRKENVTINFKSDLLHHDFNIAPLLLLPFVENAFKYVSEANGGKSFIDVSATYDVPFFIFSVHNSAAPKSARRGAGGIGIGNVSRRLQLLYPGKHELLIDQNETSFKVILKLNVARQDHLYSS